MEEKPNYYSILPANVRYDKDLQPNAKLLYSEITSLCNYNGYCFASNNYFAKLYNVDKATISRWISNLVKKGYINIKMIKKKDSESIDKRIIILGDLPIDEIINTYTQKNQYPIDEKVKDNNTSINNNKNKKEKSIFEIIEENFMRTISPIEYQEIESWEDTELTRYVISETILKGIRNLKYISRVLEDYRLNGITTIEQAKNRETQKKNNNEYLKNKQETKISKWDEIRKRVEEEKRNERR